MDRNWILKCVFEHEREAIAIETLHLNVPSARSATLGPRDSRRATELEETERRISDTSRYTGVEYQLVEDCLQAAVLTRNMERPRTEVEGQFARAQRLADTVGIPQQQLRVAYQRAWTSFWWYEDYADFLRLYDAVTPLAFVSDLSDDVEMAVNLWQLLFAACSAEKLDPNAVRLQQKREALLTSLVSIGANTERPNNALWARTQIAFLDMLGSQGDAAAAIPVIERLKKIVADAEGLIAYPVKGFARVVEELGDVFANMPVYDELIEEIASLTQERVGRLEAGRMLLARGFQKLRAGAVYDAIRFFGRAQQKLAIREAREELTEALFAGGLAYEGAGLLWAARANTLASADQTLADFREGGSIPRNALLCVRKLIWQELQLGRVPHVLQWLELGSLLAGIVGPRRKGSREACGGAGVSG